MKKYSLFIGVLVFFFASFASAQSNAPMNWWRIVTPATPGVQTGIDALPPTVEQNLKMPILIGIAPGSFAKNYGITYANGSVHQGQDIFAPRGAYVVSPTVAVVTRVDLAGAGGIAVYTANPGNETFYFAHMTAVGPTIHVGAQLQPGDLIGYVGNTGDAEGASTHLHFQIFDKDVGVVDPTVRLTNQFSENERISALTNIITRSDNPSLAASAIAKLYRPFLTTLSGAHAALASELSAALSGVTTPTASVSTPTPSPTLVIPVTPAPSTPTNASSTTPDDLTTFIPTQTPSSIPATQSISSPISQDLSLGMRNDQVKVLQQYLINKKVGIYGQTLVTYGATGYYGILTKAAVIEFQRSVGLSGSGFCGPLTRAYIASHS